MRPARGGGHASVTSSIINLLNTIIGAGTLAMPAAMSHMGILLGTFVILWSGLTAGFGLYLQGRCARCLDRGHASFFALSQITYPNAAVIFDTAIAIKCFGVGVSYMIIIGDLMPGVVLGISREAENVAYLMDRTFWITAFMLLIIPLSFLKRLDSLKYTSIVALVSIGYLIILVLYHFAAGDVADQRGPVHVIEWAGPIAMLTSFPVVVFAYTCHQNMFSILNELQVQSPMNVIRVVGTSIGSAASIYVLVAITGYLTFGDNVVGNIVSMYGPAAASTIGKAAIVVLVTFSVPLQVHPCRASLDAVSKWRPNRGGNSNAGLVSSSSASTSRAPVSRNHSRSEVPTVVAAAPVVSDHPAGVMSDLRFAVLTTFILVMAYVTAINVSSLDRVLAYVGSTGSTSISFILPGLLHYKISDPDSVYHQRLAKEDDDLVDGNGLLATPCDEDDDDHDDEEGTASHEERLLGSGYATPQNHGSRSLTPYRDVDATGPSSGNSHANLRLGGTPSPSRPVTPLAGGSHRTRARRRRWRWDLEHIDPQLIRKLGLALSAYGVVVMVVCLVMNTVYVIQE